MLSFFISLLIGQAFAGGWTSSGGNTVVCMDSHNKIKQVEMFDLFEARMLWGWQPTRSSEDYLQQARELLRRANRQNLVLLQLYDEKMIDRELDGFLARLRFLPDEAGLVPVDDSHSPVVPNPPCGIYQTALYSTDGFIYINGRTWKAVRPTDKAALILHEIIYKALRDNGETDSVRARKLVSLLISRNPTLPAPPSYPEGWHTEEHCSTERSALNPAGTPSTEFDITQISPGVGLIAFTKISGKLILDRTSISFPLTKGWPISERHNPTTPGYFSDGARGPLKSLVDPYFFAEQIWLPDNPATDDLHLLINDSMNGQQSVSAKCEATIILPPPPIP